MLLSSCMKVEKKDCIEEFILFGSGGFSSKDSTNHYTFDSTKLEIMEYFEFMKDSLVRIARSHPFSPTEYYSVKKNDTIGFDNLLNAILLTKKYKSEYNSTAEEMYDGWHYTLFYKKSNHKEFIINYVPSHLPDSLKVLHNFIKRIVLSDSLTVSNKFEFNNITAKQAKELYRKYPPPSPPSRLIKNLRNK